MARLEWIGCVWLTSALVACGGATSAEGDSSANAATVPLDTQTATETVQARLELSLKGLAEAAEMIDESQAVAIATDTGTNAMTDGCGSVDPIDNSGLTEVVGGLEGAMREIADGLQNDVFRDEFVESDDGTTVVYLLDPLVVCNDGQDAECVQELTDNPIRFSATSHADDSLRIEILVGEEMDNPATFVLTDESTRLIADLGEMMDVLERVLGEEAQGDLPDLLDGRIELAIERNAELDYSLKLAVLDAVSFSQAAGDDGALVQLTLAEAPDAMELRFNAPSQAVSILEDWNALDVRVPGSLFCGDDSNCGAAEQDGEFHLHLDGMSAGVTAVDGATSLSITNVGLGDDTSSLNLDDSPLVRMDINPSDGRHFAIDLEETAEGVLVSFSPKLDMSVAVTLMNLSESLRMDLPEWLFDEVFDVSLGGAPKSQILIPDDCNGLAGPQVVAGTLSMSASSAASDVVVEAGMCLVESDEESESGHPFDLLEAGVCQ